MRARMQVNFYATLRPIVGGRQVEVSLPEGAEVRDLVALLLERWPVLREHLVEDDGSLSRRVAVYVDGRNVRWLPDGEGTTLTPAQNVAIFPPVAGG